MSGIGIEGASAGHLPADATLSASCAAAGKLPPPDVAVCGSPQSCGAHTPLSRASTAPSTPLLSFSLDGDVHGSRFVRCISGTSTLLSEPLFEDENDEEGWDGLTEKLLPPLPITGGEHDEALEQKLSKVKEMYRNKFGMDVDDEPNEDDQQYEYDEDGTPWIKSVGSGPLNVTVLEEKLEKLKDLYTSVYGGNIDEESEDSQQYEYDEDGTPWTRIEGTGPLTTNVLEDKLAELKELYKGAYGHDVDAESVIEQFEYDADGTLWIKTTGKGPLTVSVLEERLEEVKECYKAMFGIDVDDLDIEDMDVQYDEDGIPWVITVGTGPLTVDVLEDKLAEVKKLYKQRYGQDVDAESLGGAGRDFEYDADGTPWIETVGIGPLNVGVLEESLAEVKELYKLKYRHEVDESDAEFEHECDHEGTPWIKTVGTGPLNVGVLEESLAEVKELYKLKYRKEVDESDAEFEQECDHEGTPWIKTVGTGPLNVGVLEERLAEVKELYKLKYRKEVDESDAEFENECDHEGTPWIKTVGTGPLNVGVLEEYLAEAKELYKLKFGQEVDESDTGSEYEYDQEGTPWNKTVGTGPLTVEVLEERLAEVKDLYRVAFGCDVDAESEDSTDHEYDADGTPWVKFVGAGPLTLSVLEDMIAEVKALYTAKFGFDMDAESDNETIDYDEDGTPWIQTVGTGTLSVSVLQDRLEEVKELYERCFGRFVEDDSDNEEPDLQYDQDGTRWVKWTGTGGHTCTA